MRLIVREDGSIERAAELIGATATCRSVVAAISARRRLSLLRRTARRRAPQIWRAESWLGKLAPLAQLATSVSDDHRRLRPALPAHRGQQPRPRARPTTGAPMGPLGPLPAGVELRARSRFADGWRAVVDTDLRGPLATFDAGATWRAVGLTEPTRASASSTATRRARRRWPLPHRPARRRDLPHRGPRAPRRARAPRRRRPRRRGAQGALGPQPARQAPAPRRRRRRLARHPQGTAVVARAGALARVSLVDGAVLAARRRRLPRAPLHLPRGAPRSPRRRLPLRRARGPDHHLRVRSVRLYLRLPSPRAALGACVRSAAAARHAPRAPLREAAVRGGQRQRRHRLSRALRRRRRPVGRGRRPLVLRALAHRRRCARSGSRASTSGSSASSASATGASR